MIHYFQRVALAAVFMGACVEDDGGIDLKSPGAPCRSVEKTCLDERVVLDCIDEIWVEVACSEYCEELAPGVHSAGCSEDVCVCASPPGGCTPEESRCIDALNLDWCEDDWRWSAYSCDELCAELSPQSKALGCFAGTDDIETAHCLCTSEGAECTDDSPAFCVDEFERAECVDTVWVYESCAEECSDAGYCSPEHASGALCVC